MLIEVDAKIFNSKFLADPHPFISESFINLNQHKVDSVIRLIEDNTKSSVGLVAGIKNGVIKSPFSAPFGGFHFRNEIIYIDEIDSFLTSLKEYIVTKGLKGIEIILPPDIYHTTFNAKTVNSLIRNQFKLNVPDITGCVNLQKFNGVFTQRNSREFYKQAERNGLSFSAAVDEDDKLGVYDVICQNRARFDRPIFMTFKDILDTSSLWPVDFLKLIDKEGEIVASAIFYRFHKEICYAAFWGDSESGRPLRAMDYMAFSLWSYYKGLGYSYLDIGTSTEGGNPNAGLLRFKESHESTSTLRYKFSWNHINSIS